MVKGGPTKLVKAFEIATVIVIVDGGLTRTECEKGAMLVQPGFDGSHQLILARRRHRVVERLEQRPDDDAELRGGKITSSGKNMIFFFFFFFFFFFSWFG